MKIFKRTLSALLALLLIIGMAPMPASATDSTNNDIADSILSGTMEDMNGNHTSWQLDTTTGTLTISGNGNMVSDGWRSHYEDIYHVVIENGITSIGFESFKGCSNIESFSISNTVTIIEHGAFMNCTALESIVLPESILELRGSPFDFSNGLIAITFEGNAPTFSESTFSYVTATVYYPSDNTTWTEEVKQQYGGNITWVPYGEVEECNHKYDCEQTPPATCTESGINTYTCMYCGNSYTEVVPSRGHTWSEWRPKEPGTCQKPAVEYKICISCSKEETRDGSIGEHNFVETSVTNPTCTMEGLRESTCSYCSMVSKSAIPATEHNFQNGSCTVCGTVDNYCGPNATWTFSITSAHGALLRISGSGAVTEAPWLNLYKDQIQFVEIENGITSIVSGAFRDCTKLCAVKIPSGITAIEWGTFMGCTSLGGISLPENLTSIAPNAFSGCSSLSEITLPKGVATIEPYTFYGCSSLKKVTLTSGLITIGGWAFNECTGFSEIVIPATVRQIDFGAFRSCSNLSRIIFEGNAPTFGDGAFENVTAKAFYPQDDATWTESVRQNYKGNITWIPYDVTVGAPKDTGGYCGDNAIWEYNPNTYVLTISGYGAIYDYWDWKTGTTTAPWKDYIPEISRIVISDDITRIGDGALAGFSQIWGLGGPLPSKLKSIGAYAFCGISVMHSLQIPEGVTEIGEGAFKDCLNFGTVMIPASVTSIGKGAIVVGCEVDAGNQYYSSENGFLYNKDKTLLIRVPMKYQSYYGTTSVVIPDSVTTIADGALMGCSMVNEVIIPKSVSSIGENAFASSSISNIYFSGSAPNFGANVFEGITATVSYPSSGYWPADVLQQYGGTIIWVCYESGAPEGLEYTVSANSVKITGYTGTDSTLVIPETIDGKPVTSLSEFVFRGNKTLKHLVIPSGVTTLPMFAFMDCATLESVILPDTLTSIGDYAFYRCYALKEIVVPKNVEYLFSRAFGNCTSLSKIVLKCSAHSIVQGSGVDATLGTDLFLNVKADVYYPQYDASWTNTIRKQYGGTITWIPYSNEADLACSHSWNSGTVVTAATCTTDGSMTHTCSKCGASKTVTISATGHSYLNGACPVCGTASQLPPSCGNNATWKFDAATGTLTISGSGPMADFQNSTLTPWYSYKDKIIHVVIEEGITSIDDYAFMTFTHLTNVTIPNGVTRIGTYAFEECYSLEEVIVPEGVTEIGGAAFAFCWSLRKVVLPGSLATFGNSVFVSAKFTDIYYHVDAILCLKDHMSEEGNPWPCTWIPYGECTHAWNEGTIITEPDCTNEGSLTHTCIKCNVTETAAIPANGHTEQWIPGEPSTCTKPGSSSAAVCAVCGVVIKTSEPILAIGHKEKTIPGKSATCTEAGLTDGKKCARCGEITVAQEVVPALGHTEVVTVTGNPASCTESGLSDSTKCSVCDVQLKTQEVIPPTGHAEVTITGKPASCTESGLTDGTKCSVCDTTIKTQEVIPPTGHAEVTITGKPASCTESGLTDGAKCSVCDTTIKAQESIPATGHTEEAVAGKTASCTENGLTDGKKCSICHTVTEAQTEIPALGHIWSDWTETKSSTCTEKGVIERACETCNTVETKDGELAEHQYTAVVTAPTCTEKGYTTYTCVCGNTYVGDYVDQIEHTIVMDEKEDVTCTTNGLTAGSHCSVCGKILVKQEVIYAHHTNEIISGKPASCTESGLTDGVRCTVCEKILTAQTEIPATGHNYQTEDNITFTCICGDSFNVDIKDIIDEIDPDTATKEDIEQVVDKVQEIDTNHLQIAMAVDHNNTGVVEQIAALEEMVEVDVRVEVSEASIENFEANDVTIIGAKLNNREDDEKDITLNIDETKNIKDLHIPKYCDAHSAVMFSMTLANVENPHELDVPVKIRLPIPNGMNPHKLVILHYNDDGSIQEEITPQIDQEKGQFYAIIVLSGFSDFTMAMTHEHSFSDWEVIQAATCVTIGSKKRTCNCGEVEEGEIPATGHTIVIDTKVEATCVATGLTEGKHCSVCDAILVKQAEIAKKNHNYENGSCSMCGEAEPEKPLYTLGDVDGNGKIQTNDAKLILQHIVRMPVTLNLDAADVDGNSKIQTNDAKLILQYIVKIITHFPAQTT